MILLVSIMQTTHTDNFLILTTRNLLLILEKTGLLTPELQEFVKTYPHIFDLNFCITALQRAGLLKGAIIKKYLTILLKYKEIKSLAECLGILENHGVLATNDVAKLYVNEALNHPTSMHKCFKQYLENQHANRVNLATDFLKYWSEEIKPSLELSERDIIQQAFTATRVGDIDKLKQLSDKGIDLTVLKNSQNNLLIHNAAGHGQMDILLMLKQRGASPNVEGNNDLTPIFMAASNKHLSLIPVLVSMGADVNWSTKMGYTLVHLAAQNNDILLLEMLKNQFDANLNPKNITGLTPAHIAAKYNFVSFITQLHELGADLNLPNDDNETLFDWAIANGDVEMVDALAKCGVPINEQNALGVTPILSALLENDQEMFLCLLKNIDAVRITFFFTWNQLVYIAHEYHLTRVNKLYELIKKKLEMSPSLTSFTLEDFAVALDNKVIYDYLTQRKDQDEPNTEVWRYQSVSFFKPFDPHIATRLLIEENRYGNIEARHTSSAAQKEYDKVWGLIIR